jgi:hypothetical protein
VLESAEVQGAEGLADRRLGRLSARRAPVDQVMQVLGLFETRYVGFTVKHFHEKLVELHGLKRSYTWVKKTLLGKRARSRRPSTEVHTGASGHASRG